MTLPNELLLHIFSYLPPVRVTSLFFPHLRSTRSAILALRQTCRRFRAIIANPLFWSTDDDDAPARSELVSTIDIHAVSELREEYFLTALLADPQIVKCLESKRMWSFCYPRSLFKIFKSVPKFRCNASSVTFYGIQGTEMYLIIYGQPWIYAMTETLMCCQFITTLHFKNVAMLDLDFVVASCPQLSDLRLTEVGEYIGSGECMFHLERLDIYNQSLDEFFPLDVIAPEILMDLRLCADSVNSGPSMMYHGIASKFYSFVNLTVLWIAPFYDELCDFIINSHLNLIDFGIVASSDSILARRKLVKLFQADALRNIQVLNLLVDDLYANDFEGILDAITCLPELREVEIAMGLHTSWCRKFARLTKLQSLDWITSRDSYCDLPNCNGVFHTPFYDVFGDSDMTQYHLGNLEDELIGERMFHEAFEGFKKKPHIIFEVLDQIQYKNICFRLYRKPQY